MKTGFAELDELLSDFVEGVRSVLGDNFTGAYMTGSFAIGAADVHSDVDWLVVTERALSDEETQALNALHEQLYARETHWAQHLEGSYAPRHELRRPGLERWMFLDNGATALEWDRHCNTSVVRWTVRERPVVLAGPDPRELIDPVPADALRDEARPMLAEFAEWAHAPHPGHPSGMSRWKQPYIVLTLCRALYTLETGTVCSKREAAEWAKRSLDPEWRDVIQRALDDRPDPWVRTTQDSTPELVARTRAFADAVTASV
jgi:hypothetical protein